MNRTFALLAAGALFFTACQSDPKADEAKTGEAVTTTGAASGNTYNADLTQSSVQWTGTKPVGKHVGSMMLKNGSLTVDGGNLTGGNFEIDINSMKSLDADTGGSSKLLGHLKSGDFFQTDSFPTAMFQITSVAQGVQAAAAGDELVMKDATHTVTGNLTLKGQTKSITFPAKIAVTDAAVTADANFNIDRTQWGLVYGNDEGLKDKFIRPTVNILLHLVANK